MVEINKSLVFTMLFIPSAILAAETELPQSTINKINKQFLDDYQINLSCSKGVAYPKVMLFAKGRNIFMLRDSNSSIGYSEAELQELEPGEYYHSEGMRFINTGLGNANDFYISAETLQKGEGELTAVLYRDIFKCDATLNTWSVSAAERAVARERSAVEEAKRKETERKEQLRLEMQRNRVTRSASCGEELLRQLPSDDLDLKQQMLNLMECAVHQKLIQNFLVPETSRPNSKAVYKIKISKVDGSVVAAVPVELSQDISFNIEAAQALKRLNSMDDLELDEAVMESLAAKMEKAGRSPDEVFGGEDEPLVVYVELNMTGEFVPVPKKLRR